jgi:hypothetical protein
MSDSTKTTEIVDSEEKQQKPTQEEQVNLMEMKIENEGDALNLMAGFLQIAQRRGAYSLAEASKIMEGINKFEKNSPP